MDEPTWTIRLAIILLSASGAIVTISPRLMAQTTDTQWASKVPSSQTCGCADSDSVAVSSGSEGESQSQSQSGATASLGPNQGNWVHRWIRTVDKARASQPHFVSPIVTTHVMLVQQYRYDMYWQQDPVGGTVTANYGASRGLEIIPVTRLEVGIFPPGYLVHQSRTPDGFGDLSFQIKYRAFSATEGHGNYFVGFFFGVLTT